ncbi:MAG: isochorismatase [Candidatus Endonucleobacter sp. (ex Gigantidas childressi)]|nr:isochorismatase [Candidatus Endonucleobacter sp. (ex Gigantidas childressi)]
MSVEENTMVLDAVNIASRQWKNAFNSGDAAGCAAQYEKTAIMNAKPFGTYKGTIEIQTFWQKLIDDGFTDVDYIDPIIKAVNEESALLTASWKMNNARGVITKELWVLQSDGTAKLREDDFEAQG